MSRASRKPKSTPSSNKHVFEPFSKRIARLRIDPIHNIKGRSAIDDASDLSHSFFRVALDEWSSLNLTVTFTSFLRKVNGLSETLPQLLHHADTIFESLVQHIEKRDPLALEPLLDLAAHFAHDLGKEFEKYFERLVCLIADVAASNEAPDVVEWSFTCLAWMFKYLSRLLSQDLRPLLRIFRPYLTSRKEHVSRFSAESLAFLVRKAALMYPKKKAPLTLAVTELLSCTTSDQSSRFGVMSLLLESCLGTSAELHSSAEYLVECLLDAAANQEDNVEAQEVVNGTLVGLVHETDSQSFAPVGKQVLNFAQKALINGNSHHVILAVGLLQTIVGSRKGARISSWESILSTSVDLLNFESVRAQTKSKQESLALSALLLQYAPMDKLLPSLKSLLDATLNGLVASDFFAYCTTVADLGRERFQQLLLPRLQDFIKQRYAEDETGLYLTLERLQDQEVICSNKGKAGYLESCQAWDVSNATVLESNLANGQISSAWLVGFSRLPYAIQLSTNNQTKQRLFNAIKQRISQEAALRTSEMDLSSRITLGWLFESAVHQCTNLSELKDILADLSSIRTQCWSILPFLRTINVIMSRTPDLLDFDAMRTSRLNEILISNLLLQSQDIREESLLLLRSLSQQSEDLWIIDVVDNLLSILRTPYTPSNARTTAMLVRKLPQLQSGCSHDTELQTLIPKFCLGMLSRFHDQPRADLCQALSKMLEGSRLEDTVMDILVTWLTTPANIARPTSSRPDGSVRSSIFEDNSLSQIEQLSTSVLAMYSDPASHLLARAEADHKVYIGTTPPKGRLIALSALTAMLGMSEKRSRFLTPIFLKASFTRFVSEIAESSESSASSHTMTAETVGEDWFLAERKAFVNLLAQFQNPGVLFRSAEVYDKLLDLLSNGNDDIRKSSLLAILKWKNTVLQKHGDLLLRVADQKISSTDIGSILNTESEENPVKSDERGAVLPVLLRLVYGMLVSRTGSYGSQEARRKSLLRMLFRMQSSEISLYLDVALGKLQGVQLLENDRLAPEQLRHEYTSPDQRYGFLRMILTMLETLGETFTPFGQNIIEPVLYCTMRASLQVEASPNGTSSLERTIRRAGLECLTTMLEIGVDVNWSIYMPVIFSQLLQPRLASFANENMQSVSMYLRLVAQLCSDDSFTPFLINCDDRLLPALWELLGASATKPEVKLFILDSILTPLLTLAENESGATAHQVVLANQPAIQRSIAQNLEAAPPAEILKALTAVLLKLASAGSAGNQSEGTIDLLANLLSSSKQRLTPIIKAGVLEAINAMLVASAGSLSDNVAEKLYKSVSSLFDYFKDSRSRLILCGILDSLGKSSPGVARAAKLCHALNAMSQQQLDEPDLDVKLSAFQELASLAVDDGLLTWRPILHNLLFFCRDEDFNIRSNAVSSLRVFIKNASYQIPGSVEMLNEIVLPAVQKGLTHDTETIRADFVALFGLVIEYSDNPRLVNMRPLLFNSDEEASFFANILHIQQHRRLRAMRRLILEVEKGSISAANISQVFLPLLQKFIRDQTPDDSAPGMKGQSLAAMATLLQWTQYKQFKIIFSQYKADLENEELQKTALKMLGQASDALLQAQRDRGSGLSHLAASLPEDFVLAEDIKMNLSSKLADFVHFRDEAEMSARLPAATVAVKLYKLLDFDECQTLSGPIVLDVANVLKSRAQESRDAGRGVLIEIVNLLGPESVEFVLRQLRTVLQRGYQLHVLSYTLHAILVKMDFKLSELDYCVEDLAAIIMDDTFGAVGQEKDNEDYISSMKEVKGKKSLDSMEIVARCTSLDHLGKLIQPITTVLTGSLRTKQVRQVDELLRRIGVGLARNPAASERGLLVFAYQTIQAFYKEKTRPAPMVRTNDEINRERFLLQKPAARDRGIHLLFKVARFAIDLVRSALLKHSGLMTAENVHGFLPVIGDALVEGQEDVKISAMRLASAIVKLRMPELDEKCPVFVLEAVRVVKNCTNTNEEAAQAALKLLAAILRERKSVKVRDSDVAEVLRRVTPDLEEPDRQGVTFNFIRAVLARKYQLSEVYDVVDKIAIMMVTSQANGARDVARGVYVHFLVEYPQAAGRWSKQQRFLTKNLEYEYFEGRQSVMEAINALLGKTSGETSQHLIAAFFIPIVLRMANDDHARCRELAGALLGQLFSNADETRLQAMLEPLEGWIEQFENEALLRLSLQAFSVLFAIRDAKEQNVLCRTQIARILASSTQETSETRVHAMRLLAVLVGSQPSAVMSAKSDGIWKNVRSLLNYNIPERTIAAGLVNSFLSSCPAEAWAKLPLVNSHGSRWDLSAVQDLLRSCVRIIKLNQGEKELSNEVVPLTTSLIKSSPSNGLAILTKGEDDDSDEESTGKTNCIPASRYVLDQLAYILRRELPSHSSGRLFPKTTAISLLSTLIPILPTSTLPHDQLTTLLLPLLHLTSTTNSIPFSADPSFAGTYEALTNSAQEVMGLIQDKVGDGPYIKAMTAASKIAKERREARRRKRVLDQVADPERAARLKRVKGERSRDKKREVGLAMAGKRRGRGW